MDLNVAAAWWGAIVASIVLLFDFYKFSRSGPVLKITASPNMKVVNIPSREGKTWILLTVTNIGNTPTTITVIGGDWYENRARYIFRKPNKTFIVPASALPTYDLPYVLKPGHTWSGTIPQDMETENLARRGILACLVAHSFATRCARCRVNMQPAVQEKNLTDSQRDARRTQHME